MRGRHVREHGEVSTRARVPLVKSRRTLAVEREARAAALEAAGKLHRHHVLIFQAVPRYGGGTYDLEIMSFGAMTREDAENRASEIVARANAQPYATGPGTMATRTHHAVFRRLCDVCLGVGKKPGCVRKACEACKGEGSSLA